MSKMEYLDTLEAEKFKKLKCIQFCWTPCRIRLERSELKQHEYCKGRSESPEGVCHAKQESSCHFMIDCFLYECERQILYDSVEY